MILNRLIEKEIETYFNDIPVTAIIGARQVGKTTLAKQILRKNKNVVYLDLEKHTDVQMLKVPEMFFSMNKSKIICIDEIQLVPDLFREMRSFIDENKDTKFVVLGSSSPELLRKSSETLAGRIFYYELSPFLLPEIQKNCNFNTYLLRGGFPLSLLAKNDKLAFIWLKNYIKTFLERDLRQFGFNVAPETIHRLWEMLAHFNGQVLNYSTLANSMGLSQPTVKQYIDILQYTFMLRILQPYFVNIKKRLLKSPKLYFRDTGILHALLNISSYEQLYSHPVFGSSYEISVIENIINVFTEWKFFYYRTAKGVEIDLVMTKGNRIIAIEIKSSPTPSVSKGFWNALDDINSTEAFVIAPVKMPYALSKKVMVSSLENFLNTFNG
jgi:predicted AAA+ superfamily ATPase